LARGAIADSVGYAVAAGVVASIYFGEALYFALAAAFPGATGNGFRLTKESSGLSFVSTSCSPGACGSTAIARFIRRDASCFVLSFAFLIVTNAVPSLNVLIMTR